MTLLCDHALALIKQLTEENEEQDKAIINALHEMGNIRRETKADTVSELQTRFAMRYGTYTDEDMTPITEVFRILDKFAKEMVEDAE